MSINMASASQTAPSKFFSDLQISAEQYFDSSATKSAAVAGCARACGGGGGKKTAARGARLMLSDSPRPSNIPAGVSDVGRELLI